LEELQLVETFATAHHEALSYIRSRIISGEYPGGMRINSNQIAAKLGCSRIPIREALRQLEAEGFVTMLPNRGATVAALTPEAVEDLFRIRSSLELLALDHSIGRFDESALVELTILKERMDRVRNDPTVWVEHHDRFHQFISRMAGRERLQAEIIRIHRAVRPYTLLYVSSGLMVEEPHNNHQMIVDVLRGGHKREAMRVMKSHLEGIMTNFIDYLRVREEHKKIEKEPLKLKERSVRTKKDKVVA
jgi:DNA-binding GntR family transcriptional regulator